PAFGRRVHRCGGYLRRSYSRDGRRRAFFSLGGMPSRAQARLVDGLHGAMQAPWTDRPGGLEALPQPGSMAVRLPSRRFSRGGSPHGPVRAIPHDSTGPLRAGADGPFWRLVLGGTGSRPSPDFPSMGLQRSAFRHAQAESMSAAMHASDVLIIGAGPSGLCLAAELSRTTALTVITLERSEIGSTCSRSPADLQVLSPWCTNILSFRHF